ncbi:MAG: tRNA lysidine(34) synthetase TilS [bacterium]|nr:tRNA lysidine(34) synthetase TilS [bacterium]
MKKTKILLALSGGADSVFLLYVLSRMHAFFDIYALHVNHQLRGIESDGDERFVVKLCQKLGIHLFTEKVRINNQSGIEEQARDARYSIIRRICEEESIEACFLGHNADDDVETILMNILRGTGINGLSGIKFKRDLGDLILIRPLLKFYKPEIVDFLGELEFREDSSNMSNKFLRNKLRNQVLPEFLKLNDKSKEHILNLKQVVCETKSAFDWLVTEKVNNVLIEQNSQEIVVDLSRYIRYNNQIRKAILCRLLNGKANFRHINLVFDKINDLSNGRWSLDLKGSWIIRRFRNRLFIYLRSQVKAQAKEEKK